MPQASKNTENTEVGMTEIDAAGIKTFDRPLLEQSSIFSNVLPFRVFCVFRRPPFRRLGGTSGFSLHRQKQAYDTGRCSDDLPGHEGLSEDGHGEEGAADRLHKEHH